MGKISESHRPGGQHTTVTSFRYLYNTSLSPAGIFTSHRCHLLQVSLQNITATFSCRYLYNTSLPSSPAPGAVKKNTHPVLVEGLSSMGLPCLVSSSCLSLHVLGSAPRPGHWTLHTPSPPQDPDQWRLPAPAARVQTAAYRAGD